MAKSPYGEAVNLFGLAKVSAMRQEYPEAIQYAEKAIHIFQKIGFLHIQDICQFINQTLRNIPEIHCLHRLNLQPFQDIFELTRLKYEELWKKSVEKLRNNNPDIDPYLEENTPDNRRGISLIIRPSSEIIDSIFEIQERLGRIIPNQYRYKREDYHVTLATLISAHEQFDKSTIDITAFCEAFNILFRKHRRILIHFKGITTTNNCVMVKGYFPKNTLDTIRKDLKNIALELGINTEERHANIFAHITIIRFCSMKDDLSRLISQVEELSEYEFGIDLVSEIEFVINDWYMKKENVSLVNKFSLD